MSNSFWFNAKALTTYGMSLLALAEIVDLTIVFIAIPQMMGALQANLNTIAQVTTSYIVAAAIFILLSGLFIRKFGMKKLVLVSALLFSVSSALCGLSTSLEEIILFRILQGIGGAFLPSVAQAYIAKSYSGYDQQRMMAVFGLVVVMGPVLGPVLGGELTEHMSWRWVFFVNVPICIISMLLIYFNMEKDKTENIKIDYISFFFMMVGVGCLEFFIDEGNRNSWLDSIEMIIVLATAILSLSFFIWRGLLGSSVVQFSLFKNKNFILSSAAMFFFSLLVTGVLAYFPTLLQQIYHYPVALAGLISAPRGIAAGISAPFIPWIVNKIGARLTMSLGVLLFAISCFMTSHFSFHASEHLILITMILQGPAMMAFFIPIMQICFVGFDEQQTTDVAGVFNFFRNMGSSVGTSVSATIVSHQLQVNYHQLGKYLSTSARGFVWFIQPFVNVPADTVAALANVELYMQSLFIGYLDSYYFFGIGLLLLMLSPFLLKEPDNTSHFTEI